MIQAIKCFKLRAEIFTIGRVNHNFIGIATTSKSIKIFSTKECQTVHNIHLELLGEETTALCFHPTLDLMAIANGEKLHIVNLQEHTIIQTITTNDGAIEILSFIPYAPYLISGTKSGRVMQYRYEGAVHISRLCSFPYTTSSYKKSIKNNYVSAIAHNDNYIAASGFGSALTVIRFNSHATKLTFEISTSRITAITFLGNDELLFANSDGVLFLSQIKQQSPIVQIQSYERNIIELIPFHKSPYALIVSQSPKVMLFHIPSRKIIKRDFLHFDKEIHSLLLINDEELLVTFSDRSAKKVLLASTERLNGLLAENKLLKALLLIEANPILQNTTQATEAQYLYEKLYTQVAKELFESGDKESLQEIEPFEQLKNRNKTTQELLLAYKNYPKLQNFYKEHKFALAYALCQKYPPLKMSTTFQKMENAYKKSFTLAQRQLLAGKEEQAKELLEPFRTIPSKRAMIQLLLRQNKEFLAFLKAVANRDYDELNRLVKINPNFQEIPSYIALQHELLLQIQEIGKLIDEGNIPHATALLKEIEQIPMLSEEIERVSKLTQAANILLGYYKESDFVRCYETIDKNSELLSIELTRLLEEHWRKKIDRCELFSLAGDIKALKEELGELIYISTRKAKIGDLLRVSFHIKIKDELAMKNYATVENFIYSYIDIFGIDSEIKDIMKHFEERSRKKLAITFIQKKQKKRDEWRYEDII